MHSFEADRTIDHGALDRSELYDVTKEYWDRYPLPLLHTEVNAWPEHADRVCKDTFDTLTRLRQEGYPVLGFAWYGDELQVGWHVALSGPKSYEETPVGLFYKGQPQPVARLFLHFLYRGFPAFGASHYAPTHENPESFTMHPGIA